MKEFIEFIIKHLVDKPDEVHVNELVGEQTIVFELQVGRGDIGGNDEPQGRRADVW